MLKTTKIGLASLILALILPFPTLAASISIPDLIAHYASMYAVSDDVMTSVVKCESNFDPSIQSGQLYTHDHTEWGVKSGDQELSFGLVQIHLPSHPDITKDEALNPDFSLNFLASEIAIGHGSSWTCFNEIVK